MPPFLCIGFFVQHEVCAEHGQSGLKEQLLKYMNTKERVGEHLSPQEKLWRESLAEESVQTNEFQGRTFQKMHLES